jgi:small subunit ribosomal protein S6
VPTYETLFITLPNLTEDEEGNLVSGYEQVVTEGGGSMVVNDRLGRRRLAYPIRKFEDGVYTRFLYDSEAGVPKELQRRFGLSDQVLRHLTVRLEPEWAEAAKEQAVRDAKARAEAEAARIAEAEREAEAAARAKREAEEAAEQEQAAESADTTAEPAAEASPEEPAEPVAAEEDESSAEPSDKAEEPKEA